jgi:hypothetical protein
MKLLNEAQVDDEFNRNMQKIQDAVIALEKLLPRFKETKPVRTQFRACDVAAEDLQRLSKRLQALMK